MHDDEWAMIAEQRASKRVLASFGEMHGVYRAMIAEQRASKRVLASFGETAR
jgi:hypothetical protein